MTWKISILSSVLSYGLWGMRRISNWCRCLSIAKRTRLDIDIQSAIRVEWKQTKQMLQNTSNSMAAAENEEKSLPSQRATLSFYAWWRKIERIGDEKFNIFKIIFGSASVPFMPFCCHGWRKICVAVFSVLGDEWLRLHAGLIARSFSCSLSQRHEVCRIYITTTRPSTLATNATVKSVYTK